MSSYTAVVAGGTGMIGRALIGKLLADSECEAVYALSRRALKSDKEKLAYVEVDFADLEGSERLPPCDYAFCSLGSTMKKAGSKEAFYRVDFDYVLAFGKLAEKLGCSTLLAVSSMGANASSPFFYNKVKGEAEEALAKLDLPSVHILRPSLLLGQRQEQRLGEQISQLLFQAFRPVLPSNYRAIKGGQVATAMLKLAKESQPSDGFNVHLSADIAKTANA